MGHINVGLGALALTSLLFHFPLFIDALYRCSDGVVLKKMTRKKTEQALSSS